MDLGLPSCNTIMLNAKTLFVSRLRSCPSKFVQAVMFSINVIFDFMVMCVRGCVRVFGLLMCYEPSWSDANK